MHERLAADDAEEDVAHVLGFLDHAMKRLRRHRLHLLRDIDPAALTAQIAAIDDRHIEKRRKYLAALEPAFVFFDGQHALQAHVPRELEEQALIGFEEHSLEETEVHR